MKIFDTEDPFFEVHSEMNAIQAFIALLAAEAGRMVAVAERTNDSIQNRLRAFHAFVQCGLLLEGGGIERN